MAPRVTYACSFASQRRRMLARMRIDARSVRSGPCIRSSELMLTPVHLHLLQEVTRVVLSPTPLLHCSAAGASTQLSAMALSRAQFGACVLLHQAVEVAHASTIRDRVEWLLHDCR